MRFTLSLILFHLISLCTNAQHFNRAYSFIDTTSQINNFIASQNCLIDKGDNLYTITSARFNFTVDSLGILTPVKVRTNTILGQNQTLMVITKHNSNGALLFYANITIYHSSLSNYRLSRFLEVSSLFSDKNDDIIGTIDIVGADSIVLVNRDNNMFSKIRTNSAFNSIALLFKMNKVGQFQWANTLAYKNLFPINNKFSLLDLAYKGISVNSANEIIGYIGFNRVNPPVNDTLILINQANQSSFINVNNADISLKFTSTGSLVSQYPTFRLSNTMPCASTKIIKSITKGNHTFQLISIKNIVKDTLYINQQKLALDTGTYFFLLKRNLNDSIEWATMIGTRYTTLTEFASFDFDVSIDFNKIIVGIGFYQNRFTFKTPIIIPPIYSTTSWPIFFLGEYDLDGKQTHYKIAGTANGLNLLASLTINPITGYTQLITRSFGSSTPAELLIDDFKFEYNSSEKNLIMLLLDTSLNGLEAFTLENKFNRIIVGNRISMVQFNQDTVELNKSGLGENIYDKQGRIYIPGNFIRSMPVNCKVTLIDATPMEMNNIGFVLIGKLPNKIIDTFTCAKMISPSAKYIWDSSGFYYDTIPDHIGCDSLLMIRLRILQSKSTIDTSVCLNYKSPSGKYTFDTTGIYTDTLPNAQNCDSVITIKLAVRNTQKNIDTTFCAPIKSPSNKYVYFSTGVYYDTLPNARNCDSILTIRFTRIFKKDSINIISCKNMVSPSGKYTLTQSGIYYDTLTSTKSCDSVITIRFTRQFITSAIDTFSCKPIMAPSGKYSLMATGIYYDTLLTTQNCDSVILIQFTRGETKSTVQFTICDTLLSPSKKYIYTASGTYTDTISTVNNCDSIITIQLTKLPLSITLTKSNDISCDSPTTLLGAKGGNLYQWEPFNLLQGASSSSPIAKPETTTLFTAFVRDTLGCSTSDTITIFVKKDEIIKPFPNVFSPNDDGINDCVSPNFITQFRIVLFTVYNRWGQKVYETTSPNDCWNGKDQNDSNLSSGVYLYIINGVSICNTNINQKGTITIIK